MMSKIIKIREKHPSEIIAFFDDVFFRFLLDFGFILASIFAPFWYFGAPKFDPRVELALLGVTWDTFLSFLVILACFLNDSGVIFDRFLNDFLMFCWPMLFKFWLDLYKIYTYTPHFLEKFTLDPPR